MPQSECPPRLTLIEKLLQSRIKQLPRSPFCLIQYLLAFFSHLFITLKNRFSPLPKAPAALLAIDIQYDFFEEGHIQCNQTIYHYPQGALPIPNACHILPAIHQLFLAKRKQIPFIASQDWHPLHHGSFAVHLRVPPFTTTQLDHLEQIAWPVHCVQYARGAALVHGLPSPDRIIRKGQNPHMDSYSAFFENDRNHLTTLHSQLQQAQIHTLFLFGLAYDYCVAWSAEDAIRLGYHVVLIEDASRGIDAKKTHQTREKLLSLGAEVLTAAQAIDQYPQFFKKTPHCN